MKEQISIAMHIPVLTGEAIEWLAIKPSGIYLDATIGAGGHSLRILERLTTGQLIGIDRDPQAIAIAQERLFAYKQQLRIEQENFAQIRQLLQRIGVLAVDGILADLGLSQMHLDSPERGFSLRTPGPLDMRMDPRGELTAEEIVNRYDERELATLIYKFGEEGRSQRIARAIVRARPIKNTVQLANLIEACSGSRRAAPRTKHHRIHPATKTFQALRIAVNQELECLQDFLASAPQCLAPGGRLVIISFHSLEDRMVKQAFRKWHQEGHMRNLTRHVVKPSLDEIRNNPRSRSARLRAAERMPAGDQ